MTPQTLTSKEAAAKLGIKEATLYAYVSRGMIRSVEGEGDPRARRYLAEDVQVLMQRKAHRRDPAKAAEEALDWGTPVLESALTRIEGGTLYYRGRDAAELARSVTLEDAAALLWQHALPLFPLVAETANQPDVPRVLNLTALQSLVALAGADDLRAYDTSPAGAAATGGRILRLLTAGITGRRLPERSAEALAAVYDIPRKVFDGALILLADHELNASSFAARVIASTGAHPYAVVCGAMAALSGPKHGGATLAVHAFLGEAEGIARPEQAVSARIRRGEPLPGFGHRLYPDGDPRLEALFSLFEAVFADLPRYQFCRALADAGAAATGQKPNVDFALASLVFIKSLPAELGPMLFALGRSAGWIAHAIEQYADGRLIRPRARYVGE